VSPQSSRATIISIDTRSRSALRHHARTHIIETLR
jgi:hypothetical protein